MVVTIIIIPVNKSDARRDFRVTGSWLALYVYTYVYIYIAKDLSFSLTPLLAPSLFVISRLPTTGRYPVLIRGELSSRFKLYDPAIKIVFADNYVDGRNCKPLSRGVLSNTLSVEAFVSPILRTICWSD